MLTAILEASGELPSVIREAIELQDPPSVKSFLSPGFNIGGPSRPKKLQPLIPDLQKGIDMEKLERREKALKERERLVKVKEDALKKQELNVEQLFKDLVAAASEPYIRICEQQKQRLRQVHDEVWAKAVKNANWFPEDAAPLPMAEDGKEFYAVYDAETQELDLEVSQEEMAEFREAEAAAAAAASVGPSTSSVGPSASSVGPSTSVDPSASLVGPSASSVGLSASSVGPSTSSVGPSASSVGLSASSVGPSTSSDGPGASSVGPSASFVGPSASSGGPSASLNPRGTSASPRTCAAQSTSFTGSRVTPTSSNMSVGPSASSARPIAASPHPQVSSTSTMALSARPVPAESANYWGGTHEERLWVEEAINWLEKFKVEFKCTQEVGQFLRPYVYNCLRRHRNGEPFVTLGCFFLGENTCDICFHSEVPHTRAQCRKVCCGRRRCGTCLHVHFTGRCICDHTYYFLERLRVRFTTG